MRIRINLTFFSSNESNTIVVCSYPFSCILDNMFTYVFGGKIFRNITDQLFVFYKKRASGDLMENMSICDGK